MDNATAAPPPRLLRFAEDPEAFIPLGPADERLEDPRFVLTLAEGGHWWSATVRRVRLRPGEVAAAVAEVRALVAGRGRDAAAWSVGWSATPADLVERLVALGMDLETHPSDAMVLTVPPAARPSTLEIRATATAGDRRAAAEIAIEAFGFPPEAAEEERRQARRALGPGDLDERRAHFLVLEEGRPIATGRAWFTPWGAYLGGGGTLPSARGRGAMTALIAAAWDEAARRGTPALVALGGAMSAPILRQLGFRRVGTVWHLADRFGPAAGGPG